MIKIGYNFEIRFFNALRLIYLRKIQREINYLSSKNNQRKRTGISKTIRTIEPISTRYSTKLREEVTEKTYKINAYRVIQLWIIPILLTLLAGVIIYWKTTVIRTFTTLDYFAWFLYFMFSVGIFCYLFLDHLAHARKTELIIKGNFVKIKQGTETISTNIESIEEITEYAAQKLPWGFIVKWIIQLPDKEIIISSLTISQSNFHSHFKEKTRQQQTLFPVL